LVNAGNKDKSTPLLYAASKGNLEIVKYLLEQGASLTVKGQYDYLPIHDAVYGKHFEVLKYLVEAGSPLNEVSKVGNTPFIVAVKQDFPQGARYLLERGCDANIHDKEGRSAFHLAIEQNLPEMVEFLVNEARNQHKYKGAINSLESMTKHKFTPLTYACVKGTEQIATILLEAGADVNAKMYANQIELRLGLLTSCFDCVFFFFLVGFRAGADNMRPIYCALIAKNYSCARILVKHKAELNVKIGDCTPLCLAAQSGIEPLIRQMLIAGANPEPFTIADRWNPITYAARSNSVKAVQVLLDYGAKLNSRSDLGRTALDQAIWAGSKDTARFLKSKGAWRYYVRGLLRVLAMIKGEADRQVLFCFGLFSPLGLYWLCFSAF